VQIVIEAQEACGNCGGPVETPAGWYGVHPPIPTCRDCGATVKNPHGPVLAMNPPTRDPEALPYGSRQDIRHRRDRQDGLVRADEVIE
jgi:hypothetical protein